MRAREPGPAALALILAAAAAILCLEMPPLVAFEPRPLLGLAIDVLGATAALWPGDRPIHTAVRVAGATTLWLTVMWCVLTRPAPFSQPEGIILAQRAMPVLLVAGVWAALRLAQSWQRRTVIAVITPSIVALAIIGWINVPQTVNFQPNLLAIDSHGTLYATDRDSSVIRVFGPDGSLRAKLWPGLAVRQGPPGPGFSPTGPFNDPERLGLVPTAVAGGAAARGGAAWSPKSDPFQFCGLAVDARDRLYVPDPENGAMLRFGADGYLQARWPLPADFQASPGCVAAAADRVYLAMRGAVLALTSEGRTLARWPLPDAAGAMSASPDGAHVYVLSVSHIYAIDTDTGKVAAWKLMAPSGGIVALSSGRVVVGDHLHAMLDVYCSDGRLCAHVGGPGEWPGQFWQLAGLATDPQGRLYVADYGHRVVQSFTPAGHVTELYWSVEDDQGTGEGQE